jgi:hypothetical protein
MRKLDYSYAADLVSAALFGASLVVIVAILVLR